MSCPIRSTVFAVGLALALGACDSTPTGTSGDELSTSEAGALTEEATEAALTGFFGALSGSASAVHPGLNFSGAAAIPFERTVSHTQACEGSGTVAVSGSISGDIDETTQSGTLTLDIRADMNDCRVGTEEGQFVVNTTPDLRMQGDFSFENGQPSGNMSFTFTGSFAWASVEGDRSGSCSIDLSISVSATGQGTVTGTACGQNVSQSV